MRQNRWWLVALPILTLILPASRAAAGTPSPDLEPERGYWGFEHDAYAGAVTDALLSSTSGRKCQMVFLPSFQRESAVHLVRGHGPSRGSVIVIATEARRQIWGEMMRLLAKEGHGGSFSVDDDAMRSALARVSRAVRRTTAPLDAQTANLLEKVWEQMLARSRVPSEPNIGVDGTSYHAAHLLGRIGYRCATTWSPPDGSLTHGFVVLASALRDFTRTSARGRKTARGELVAKAQALLDRIAAANKREAPSPPASSPATQPASSGPCEIRWRAPKPRSDRWD